MFYLFKGVKKCFFFFSKAELMFKTFGFKAVASPVSWDKF